jgi:hypothetical protein
MTPRIKTVTLDSTETTEALGYKQKFGDERYLTHHMLGPDLRGEWAVKFVERWAMVAAVPDGEDSAGRQKLRQMKPAELAAHACECVEALFNQFEERHWLLTVPPFEDVVKLLADPEDLADVERMAQSLSQGQPLKQDPLPPGGPTPETKG